MTATATPIFVQVPFVDHCSLAAATACTTRAPTATASLAAANILLLCDASTNGKRVDKVVVNACSSSITAPTVAQIVGIWRWSATAGMAYLINEIVVTARTPSTTSPAFSTTLTLDPLGLDPADKLYCSTTVTTTASTTALQVAAYGGKF